MTTEDKKQLADLIDKAESECKWLHCSYQDLWFSPAQLRAENAKGSFVWGVVNWTLRDPKEKLARLQQEEKNATSARERFERELQNGPDQGRRASDSKQP
jgi:hypothetical protein